MGERVYQEWSPLNEDDWTDDEFNRLSSLRNTARSVHAATMSAVARDADDHIMGGCSVTFIEGVAVGVMFDKGDVKWAISR